jgi:predicted aminopeptidase
MDAAKQDSITEFRKRYVEWRDTRFPNNHRYDAFVAAPINNASLLPFGLYDGWMPVFTALFAETGRDWPAFYARVRELAHMNPPEREKKLKMLAATPTP